jgi:hypothetical protein
MDQTHPFLKSHGEKSPSRGNKRKGNIDVTEKNVKKSPKIRDSSSDTDVEKVKKSSSKMEVTETPDIKVVSEQTGIVPAVTRYLVIKDKDAQEGLGSLKGLSPFIINKQIMYHAGQVKNIKKLRNGTLLIETVSDKQTANLLKLTSIGPVNVQVEPHRQLNVSQGVISCWDLLNVAEEEIKAELADQHVIEVRRIKSKKSGTLQPTPSLIITFSLPTLPTCVKAAFYNLPVRPYIPSPLRCFKCQHYGHTSTSCKATSAVCPNCGTSSHGTDPCKLKSHCVNCKGDHTAWSRDCPTFKEEKRIRELMVIEKISFTDAKRRLKATAPTLPSGAFSVVAARSAIKLVSIGTQTSTVSTQTDVSATAGSPKTSRTERVRSNEAKQPSLQSETSLRGSANSSPRKNSKLPRSPLGSGIKRLPSQVSPPQSPNVRKPPGSLTEDMVEDPFMDGDWYEKQKGGKSIKLKRK